MTFLEKAPILLKGTTLSNQRNRQRLFNCPSSSIYPHQDSVVRNSNLISPFFERLCFTIESYLSSRDSVCGLFLPSRPLTIFFTIVPVVVLALYRSIQPSVLSQMFVVTFPHVFHELVKVIPLTSDSTSPIAIISGIIRVIADRFDPVPRIFQLRHALIIS